MAQISHNISETLKNINVKQHPTLSTLSKKGNDEVKIFSHIFYTFDYILHFCTLSSFRSWLVSSTTVTVTVAVQFHYILETKKRVILKLYFEPYNFTKTLTIPGFSLQSLGQKETVVLNHVIYK